LNVYPAYGYAKKLDELRASDYGRLYRLGQVFLDYAGCRFYLRFPDSGPVWFVRWRNFRKSQLGYSSILGV